jgi:hypothetical protein
VKQGGLFVKHGGILAKMPPFSLSKRLVSWNVAWFA